MCLLFEQLRLYIYIEGRTTNSSFLTCILFWEKNFPIYKFSHSLLVSPHQILSPLNLGVSFPVLWRDSLHRLLKSHLTHKKCCDRTSLIVPPKTHSDLRALTLQPSAHLTLPSIWLPVSVSIPISRNKGAAALGPVYPIFLCVVRTWLPPKGQLMWAGSFFFTLQHKIHAYLKLQSLPLIESSQAVLCCHRLVCGVSFSVAWEHTKQCLSGLLWLLCESPPRVPEHGLLV